MTRINVGHDLSECETSDSNNHATLMGEIRGYACDGSYGDEIILTKYVFGPRERENTPGKTRLLSYGMGRDIWRG